MQNDVQKEKAIPEDIQEIIRSMASAVRAVKLYPQNNPIYSQTVSKSFLSLERYLKNAPEVRIGVQKNGFAYGNILAEKDMQLQKSLAGDLFQKGIREISFAAGLTEKELLNFYRAISMSLDELNISGGIGSLLWEKGDSHVRITDASLDKVIREEYGKEAPQHIGRPGISISPDELNKYRQDRGMTVYGRTIVLSDLIDDPARFGSMMLEMAGETGETGETGERRTEKLFDMYREIGGQILQRSYNKNEALFQSLAESIISMDPVYQNGLIMKTLYREYDRDAMQSHMENVLEQAPHGLAEITSARYSSSWNAEQVSALLKNASSQHLSSAPPSPEMQYLPKNIQELAKELSEYTPEEMEALRKIGEHGQERDTLQATVRTLMHLLPLIPHHEHPQTPERTAEEFSKTAGLLEDMLFMLLNRKDYELAAEVIKTFRTPVDQAYRARLAEAIKKAGEKKRLERMVDDLRAAQRDSSAYRAVYSYLSLMDREVTPVLLEMLAVEQDRTARKFLVQVLKDLGKNQLAVLGEKLSDERWYYVRNVVGILGDSKREDVIGYLEKVAGHKNFQIRQEVARALLAIGGKKAAELLARFLSDKDIDIRFMAVRGLGGMTDAAEKEAGALMGLLKGSKGVGGAEHELRIEAIESLGKIGKRDAAQFLARYEKIKWWKARKPQEEMRSAARKAVENIERRLKDAGSARRRP